MAIQRTKKTRTPGDYTVVEMVRGFIEPSDARRWVLRNLDVFKRVAKGGRGCRIARWALDLYVSR